MSESINWGGVIFLTLLILIALAIFLLLLLMIARFVGVILKRKFRTKRLLLLGTSIFILVSGISFIYFFMPFGPVGKAILITQATTHSGMEMRLTQTRNRDISEPYTISFYYKNYNDESWKWFYIDHEDFYWRSGAIKIDEDNKKATLFRGSKALACFDWEQETLTFFNSRGIIKGPQKIIPDGELEGW